MTPAGSIATTAKRHNPPVVARWARGALAIAVKDLRSELRSKDTINASLSFALVILLLFSFAFDPGVDTVREISGGLLWLVFAFAGALVLNRSYSRELPNDCLDALLSSPISGAQLFIGKCVANWVLLLVIEIVCIPVFGVFYNVRWTSHLGQLALVFMLGTWALTVIGTMFSAMTVNLRLREIMLPILVYPMMIPALMGAIRLTTLLMAGTEISGDDLIWFRLLIGFNIIFTILGVAFVEIVLIG